MGRVTDQQVRKLMEEMARHGKVGLASMRVGMDRTTGRKYLRQRKLPSELRRPRSWRTRPDPFAAAAIDRIVHHAVILELTGPSYRAEAAKARLPKEPAATP
jgi:hypothetical protein